MSGRSYSDQQLLAYLDEMLPADQMASVEQALRQSEALGRRLAGLAQRRDRGDHSVGEIWRRQRLSCPTRSQLGSYLLGTLDGTWAEYIEFHLRTAGCRYCTANLADLEQAHKTTPDTKTRRRKFFQSSAGYLRQQRK